MKNKHILICLLLAVLLPLSASAQFISKLQVVTDVEDADSLVINDESAGPTTKRVTAGSLKTYFQEESVAFAADPSSSSTFDAAEWAADLAITSAWADVTGTPTTLQGYGIADAYTITAADAAFEVAGAAATVQADVDANEIAAAAALAAATHAYARMAWVDPIDGSDVTGAVGRLGNPYATIEEARDDLLVAYTPSAASPVTIKTLGASLIPVSGNLITTDGFILDLRDGSTLQAPSGQMFVLGAGESLKVIGGELIADVSYAVVNTDGKFEAIDCLIEGNAVSSSRIIAYTGTGSASELILNRCVITNSVWASNNVKITDCEIVGNLKFLNAVDFEIWDSKIVGKDGLIFSGVNACVYFSDGGAAHAIRGLFRNCYFSAPADDSYPIVHSINHASTTSEVSLQGCQAFTGHSKIIYKQGGQTMRFEGNVLYGNLATVGDGVLDGLTYDGDTTRTW